MWPIFRTAACESSLFDRGLQLEYIWAYQYHVTLYGPFLASFLVYCLRLEYKLCSVHDRRMLKFEGYIYYGAGACEFAYSRYSVRKLYFLKPTMIEIYMMCCLHTYVYCYASAPLLYLCCDDILGCRLLVTLWR